jgi:hypothetical protein
MLHTAGGTTQSAPRGSRWSRWWSRVVGPLAVLFRKPTQAGPQVANGGATDLRPHNVYEAPGADPFGDGSSLSLPVDMQLMADCQQMCFCKNETGGLKNGR